MQPQAFRTLIQKWFRANGRHSLPWRRTRDPYRILISEVMLQQTQVARVIPKFRAFLKAFPSVRALDRAPLAHVLRVWRGMGYNRRAVYLKRAARTIASEWRGNIPDDVALLRRLPGVGAATAGAVLACAFNRRVAFLETNIRRVYLHYFFPGRQQVSDAALLRKIQETLPRRNIREWYYALMDYGALALRTVPNPNRRSACYQKQSPFRGSRRALRGQILAAVISQGAIREEGLSRCLRRGPHFKTLSRRALHHTTEQMVSEGLLGRRGGKLTLPCAP